jgi:tripeptide aminopeptidase
MMQPRNRLRSSGAANDEWVKTHSALGAGRREWALQQQIRLARIAAPTGHESTRALAVQQALRQCGLGTATIDRVGNVRAVIGSGTATPLVCLAHLDTVYDHDCIAGESVPVVQHDHFLRAPGVSDNCRGLAALLALAHVLQRPDVTPHLVRPVHLVATVAEEGDGNLHGARTWFDDAEELGVVPFAALAVDGPGDESIVHHAAGSHRLRVALRGDGGHSWVHADAANPIHALGEFIARAHRLGNARRREAVVHITRMHGGESLTAIPREAWVDVDLRGTSAARIELVRRELVRLAHQVTPTGLQAELTVLGDRPAGALDADHALVRAAVRATEAVGCVPRSAVASTDANIPLSRGIPAIAIGAGGTGGATHTRDEWYDDTHGARGLERLVRLVLDVVT